MTRKLVITTNAFFDQSMVPLALEPLLQTFTSLLRNEDKEGMERLKAADSIFKMRRQQVLLKTTKNFIKMELIGTSY